MYTTESGHAKNTANFEHLLTILASYGSNYAPSKPGLAIANLQNVLQNAQQAVADVKTTYNTWKNATNTREIAFQPLRHLSTRLVSALIACGAVQQTVNDLRTINRKIQGSHSKLTKADAGRIASGNTTLPVNPGDAEPVSLPKNISTSQRSYDSLIDHFDKAAILLASEALYSPAENDLQVATVNAQIANLRTINAAAYTSYTDLTNARIRRNKVLYDDPGSLIQLAKDIKAYIKSKFGPRSQEYAQVQALMFVRLRTLK